jgi:MoaA/NifB/PqqE/SkfB family radical SAM enzyme
MSNPEKGVLITSALSNEENTKMLTGIHVILTYACNFECDHCFLYRSPRSQGTFTIGQVTHVLDEAKKIGTVDWIFYEGGEPFLLCNPKGNER